jgi:hypothetical protein
MRGKERKGNTRGIKEVKDRQEKGKRESSEFKKARKREGK